LACVAGDCGVRSPGCKPKLLSFHPGVAGEGKAGRVNASESSYAPLPAAPRDGMFQRGIGLAVAKRQAPAREAVLAGRTPPSRSKEGTHPGRVSCVRNTETPTESRIAVAAVW
jgi:hypothetical protein